MTPEQTVQASIDLNATVLMPIHWENLSYRYTPGKSRLGVQPSQANKIKFG
ncbi:MAG: hypothetical protein IM574_00035 [Cytophagales bacterium]|jgi:L-ascorbate metabolism protein UlaG (beta-lactamase superfamily)|nr:hypothetical protein [Cytophagales bacterium]MCA6389598.1 hypothetical protein [Cytophagales bacterium]MCA6392487.1 hypothetical protein [Cytophagales bacterium]MCA6402932.1 hypothetical protein [Cytophagales bacterium]MCA6406940.1 hypothetical protein [Cytophagales bacterium]